MFFSIRDFGGEPTEEFRFPVLKKFELFNLIWLQELQLIEFMRNFDEKSLASFQIVRCNPMLVRSIERLLHMPNIQGTDQFLEICHFGGSTCLLLVVNVLFLSKWKKYVKLPEFRFQRFFNGSFSAIPHFNAEFSPTLRYLFFSRYLVSKKILKALPYVSSWFFYRRL